MTRKRSIHLKMLRNQLPKHKWSKKRKSCWSIFQYKTLSPFLYQCSFPAMAAFTGNVINQKPSELSYEINISLIRFCSDPLVHWKYLNYSRTTFALLRDRIDQADKGLRNVLVQIAYCHNSFSLFITLPKSLHPKEARLIDLCNPIHYDVPLLVLFLGAGLERKWLCCRVRVRVFH